MSDDTRPADGRPAPRPWPGLGGRPGSAWWRLRRDPRFWVSASVLGLLAVLAVGSGFGLVDPWVCDLSRSVQPPTREHPFGFSLQGCDYLAETVVAARASLLIAAVVVTSAALVAVLLGAVAGWFGGWADAIISRAVDAWFAVPLLLGGLIFLALLDQRSVWTVALVLALFGWPAMVRIVRGSVLQVKEQEYVQAAIALGADDVHVLRRHVIPNAVRPLVVFASAYAGIVIAVEATLSYMGVGLQMPTLSWGILLFEAQYRIRDAPHLFTFPAAALVLTVLCFVLLGESLRDAFDPRAR